MISSIFEKIASFYCLHIPLDAPKKLEWDSAYFIQKKTSLWSGSCPAPRRSPGRAAPSPQRAAGEGRGISHCRPVACSRFDADLTSQMTDLLMLGSGTGMPKLRIVSRHLGQSRAALNSLTKSGIFPGTITLRKPKEPFFRNLSKISAPTNAFY